MIKLNRKLWGTLFFIFMLLILTSLFENGGRVSGVAVTCPSNKALSCPNPFYNSFDPICEKNPEICEVEYIPGGTTIGGSNGKVTKFFPLLSLILLVVGILAEVYFRVVKK